jgi:hypothetical protein
MQHNTLPLQISSGLYVLGSNPCLQSEHAKPSTKNVELLMVTAGGI